MNARLVFNNYDFLAKHQVRVQQPTGVMLFLVEAVNALLPADENATLIDVGGGTNSYLTFLPEGYRRVIVDCAAKALRDGFQGIRTVVGALPEMGLRTGIAEWVSACQVIEHLAPDIYAKSLAEPARLSNRFVAITSPFLQHLESANVRCERCKAIYQCEGHFRTFGVNDIIGLQNYFGGLVRIGFRGSGQSLRRIVFLNRIKQIRYFLRRIGLLRFPKVSFTKCPVCGHEEFHGNASVSSTEDVPDQAYFVARVDLSRRAMFGKTFMAVFERGASCVEL
jgi:hypothetical protein